MADVAAVDIGGTRIKAAIVHDDGTYELARTLATPPDLEFRLGEVVGSVVGELARDLGRRPGAVGLAAPGLVDDTRALGVFSANLGWRAIDLRRPIVEATGLPVAVGHDVRAGLIAEAWRGAARGCADAAFVPIGTGIAAALLVDGRVLVAGGFAGEIGHVVVAPGGPPCGCGGRGCLEAVASAAAIARAYVARSGPSQRVSERDVRRAADDDAHRTAEGSLRRAAEGGPRRPPEGDDRHASENDARLAAEVDARRVAELVLAGDPIAVAVWGEAVDQLSRVLATLALGSGAQLIVIGGGLAEAGDTLLRPLQAGVTTYGGTLRPLRVVAAELGEFAGCLGAGKLALRLLEHA